MKLPVAFLAASLAGASLVLAVPPPTGEPAKPLPPAVPGDKAAEAAIKTFRFDPTLKVELFAAEPLLANGVAFSPDNHGHWYVAETYRQEKGVEDNRSHTVWLNDDIASRSVEDRLAMMHKFYPDPKAFAEKFATEEERIVRVDSTTGGVKADRTTIVADGFRDPLDGTGAGILVRGDDVWWTCIPNLWHFKVGADGKATTRDKLLTGFGIKFAFRGHDMHGLRFGPDGKVYFSIGDRGLRVMTKEGQLVTVPDTGAIMRCNPDGTGFEIFATGVRNPQELAFDEFGNLFTGDNNSDSGDKARFAYLVEGGDSGWRMTYQYMTDRGPWNREKLWDDVEGAKAKYIIPPIANIGNGPSGLTYNPGTGLSEKHYGHFFLADFRGGATASVTHEIAIEPQGAFFKLKDRQDFLKGVLNTDVEFGPDGKLYVLDWVESWGGVNKGRIYKFTDSAGNSTLQTETQKLLAEGPGQKPVGDLAAQLSHPDQRVRQAAQFELVVRGHDAVAVFTKVAQPGTTLLARLHAIWGLGQLHELAPVLALLDDQEPEVRAQAARVLSDARYAPAAEKLVGLLKDAAPRPRFFAAVGLGRLAFKPAVEPLFTMLAENKTDDPILRHGAVMGLLTTATADQLVAKAGDPSVQVRVGALLALRRQQSPAIAKFLADKDQTVVLEAARAIYDVPIEPALPALGELVTHKEVKDPNLILRVLNAHYRLGQPANAVALAVYASDATMGEANRRVALDCLADWANPAPRDRLLNLHRPLPNRGPENAVLAATAVLPSLLRDKSPGIQQSAAALASKLNVQSSVDSMYALASDPKANAGARVAALRGLVSLKDPRLAQLARNATEDRDASVRAAGLQALAGTDPALAVKTIEDIVTKAPPLEKQAALLALKQIQQPEAAVFVSQLLDQLNAGKLAPQIQLEVLEAARQRGTPELKAKLQQYTAALPKDDALATYRECLQGGNVARGRRVFREKAETQCLRCHKCETGDSVVGPELTHIAAKRDRAYILESIVYPNKRIAEGFETVVLSLKDGRIVAGRLLKADAASLTVEVPDAKNQLKPVAVPAGEVVNRMSAPSPMPENIRDFLTRAELRDLVEYLSTRK